jgi:hypothetical protein
MGSARLCATNNAVNAFGAEQRLSHCDGKTPLLSSFLPQILVTDVAHCEEIKIEVTKRLA